MNRKRMVSVCVCVCVCVWRENRERMKALDAKKEEKYAIDFLNQYNSIYLKLTS